MYEKMKIVFLLPHIKISGGVRVLLTYAHFLSRQGNKVIVAIENKRQLRRIIANFFGFKPKWFLQCSAKFLRVENFDEENLPPADAVVASHWESAIKVDTYSKKMGEKFHFIQHDERFYHGAPEGADRAYRLPLKKVVVSTWLREIIKKDYQQDANVLLNTIDKNLFYPISKIKRDFVKILLLHHDYEWKGTKEGVEIVQKLKAKYPSIKLVLFGARKEDAGYLCDEYYYNVPQNQLASLYSDCDIFLCPSWGEGFGLPSLEAMACRCAVVTYDNGGSRDFAFHEKTALVAKRKDKEDLMRQLERMIVDENLRRTMAENGYRFVQSMPTWEDQARKLEDIFKKAIQHA